MVLRRSSRQLEAYLRESEEWRAYLRQLNLRSERVLGGLAERIEQGTRELREHRREFAEHRRQLAERHRDLLEQSRAQRREFVEEMRAQRAALFRMLDKLDGGESPAGA